MLNPKNLRHVLLSGFVLTCSMAVRADPPAASEVAATPAILTTISNPQQSTPAVKPVPNASPVDTAAASPELITAQSVVLPPPGLCPVITDLLTDICAQSAQGATCAF